MLVELEQASKLLPRADGQRRAPYCMLGFGEHNFRTETYTKSDFINPLWVRGLG